MDIRYRCGGGLDVHTKTVVACLIKDGQRETRTFSTMTDDILALTDWLGTEGYTHVAIERTGIYWRPVFNLLEEFAKVSGAPLKKCFRNGHYLV